MIGPTNRPLASSALVLASMALVVAAASRMAGQTPASSWLDRPLSNWNTPGALLFSPQAEATESREALSARCDLDMTGETGAERDVAAAGWIPFRYFDRQLRDHDLEIVGGLAGSDGMCRPTGFNVFVFVGGIFAGTLSPVSMDSRSDGVSGAIRILSADTVSAEYARYSPDDALCCPASRVTVTFQVDRTGASPVVVPTAIRTTRGY